MTTIGDGDYVKASKEILTENILAERPRKGKNKQSTADIIPHHDTGSRAAGEE